MRRHKWFFLLFSAITGFNSIAFELIWARLYNFTSGSRAEVFGAFLGFYLLGLAAGSVISRILQSYPREDDIRIWRMLALVFLAANVAGFLITPFIGWAVTKIAWMYTLPIVAAASSLLGLLFPLLCHYLVDPDKDTGRNVSYLYVANIIGCGAGSLLTGFVLMEHLSLANINALLLLFACCASVFLCVLRTKPSVPSYLLWGCSVVLALTSHRLHDRLYEHLMYKQYFEPGFRFETIIEDKHGVITVSKDHTVFGNGAYDGRIDVDPRTGGGLFRPYFLPALHPSPKDVLMIGLSGGSWAQIITHNPDVERMTAVEISSGYLRLIRSYPEVSSLLTNPKIEIVVDDGRRWLRRNPDKKFDLIVMNTTFHWRELSSALLSVESLRMMRAHLKKNGLVMWNCTGSARAIRTGMEVFPHTIMVGNNCVGSVDPITIDTARWRSSLAQYRIDGRPVFDFGKPSHVKEFERMTAFEDISPSNQSYLQKRDEMQRLYGSAVVITDDNMGDEYDLDLSRHPSLARLLRWK